MSYDDLLLNDTSRLLLDSYLKQPRHAVLLTGQEGMGLGTLASALANKLVDSPGDILVVQPDEKGNLSIERVRNLYVETRDVRQSRQVVIIDNLDTMSLDGQNAFLKLLEEPNKQIHFVMTTHHLEQLLPTIVSRSASIELKPLTKAQSEQILRNGGVKDTTSLSQMLFIAEGRPAELVRLAGSKEYFEDRSKYVKAARQMLEGNTYDKLTLVGAYGARPDAIELVRTLGQLLQFMYARGSDPRLLDTAEVVEEVAQRLEANGNIKTQLMYLASAMP